MKMITVATSGFFNPIHSGHLKLLKEAKNLGEYLIVIVNNDKQVKIKGSTPFMSQDERVEILKSIRWVDEVVLSIDTDGGVSKTLEKIRPTIFAKGGDSVPTNVPEIKTCRENGIKVIFGVGGGKIQSSSWLIRGGQLFSTP